MRYFGSSFNQYLVQMKVVSTRTNDEKFITCSALQPKYCQNSLKNFLDLNLKQIYQMIHDDFDHPNVACWLAMFVIGVISLKRYAFKWAKKCETKFFH